MLLQKLIIALFIMYYTVEAKNVFILMDFNANCCRCYIQY